MSQKNQPKFFHDEYLTNRHKIYETQIWILKPYNERLRHIISCREITRKKKTPIRVQLIMRKTAIEPSKTTRRSLIKKILKTYYSKCAIPDVRVCGIFIRWMLIRLTQHSMAVRVECRDILGNVGKSRLSDRPCFRNCCRGDVFTCAVHILCGTVVLFRRGFGFFAIFLEVLFFRFVTCAPICRFYNAFRMRSINK